MRFSSLFRYLGHAALALGCASCFAVADLERFEPSTAQLNVPFRNLKLTWLQMTPHPAQLFEYRIVGGTNVVQSRGILNPLGSNDLTLEIPFAVPLTGGPYRLDFYGDQNNSGGYDGIGSVLTNDHAWRFGPLDRTDPAQNITVSPDMVEVSFSFLHNTIFKDIDELPDTNIKQPPELPGLDITLSFTAMDRFLVGDGKQRALLARVSAAAAGNTVGLYRIPTIRSAAFELKIPGMVEQGVSYKVDVWIDANGSGTFDDPERTKLDEGWRVFTDASIAGLNVRLDANAIEKRDVPVGPI